MSTETSSTTGAAQATSSLSLFNPYQLGALTLKNRIAMAPMTRSRAIGNVPNELMATYYAQRASAGLIITEGVSPSPNGLGYARIPGIFNDEQVAGWRLVTDAVHAAGGHIFIQLMHTGRIGHPANLPAGAEMVAPSAINSGGKMWVDATMSMEDEPTARALETEELAGVINEYVNAAKLAIAAGFDGVELHAANGYLLEQFLSPAANQRTDAYGGSNENRNRFVLQTAQAVADAIGADKVGIRISPFGVFNGIAPFDGIEGQYLALVHGLSEIGLTYLHLVDHSSMGTPALPKTFKQDLRNSFKGTFILSGGYDAGSAQADLNANKGDLVAFGRPFLGNPDLVYRLQNGHELATADQTTFYTPGAAGYTDYPALSN